MDSRVDDVCGFSFVVDGGGGGGGGGGGNAGGGEKVREDSNSGLKIGGSGAPLRLGSAGATTVGAGAVARLVINANSAMMFDRGVSGDMSISGRNASIAVVDGRIDIDCVLSSPTF